MKKILVLTIATLAFGQLAKADSQCGPAICTIMDVSTQGDCDYHHNGINYRLIGDVGVGVSSSAVGRVQTFKGPDLDCNVKLPATIITDQYKKAKALAAQLKAVGACVVIVDQVENP